MRRVELDILQSFNSSGETGLLSTMNVYSNEKFGPASTDFRQISQVIMSCSTIYLGSSNVRIITKESHPKLQKSILTHLKSRSLPLDILCLQYVLSVEVLSFTDTHQHIFCTCLFLNTPSEVTWRTVIIYHDQTLIVKVSQTYLDERRTSVSIMNAHDHKVCFILNLYVIPAHGKRFLFFDSTLR